MFKSLVALALSVAISACATRPSAQSAESAEAAQPAQAQAQAQSRRVCETIEDDATGTKIARRQECRNVAVDKHKQPKAN